MRELRKNTPNPADLLLMTADELAWAMLEAMQQRARIPTNSKAYRDAANELFDISDPPPQNPVQHRDLKKKLDSALKRGFKRLEEWDFIEPDDGIGGDSSYLVLTEQGAKADGKVDFERVRQRNLLSAEMLHPKLRGTVHSDFMAGRFNDAVFGAFKLLETEIRTAAVRPEGEIGTELLRVAFNEKNGPLTDEKEKPSQRRALLNLFDGAFGYFRNADAHTNRDYSDVFEPMQELMMVSRLLAIVVARSGSELKLHRKKRRT